MSPPDPDAFNRRVSRLVAAHQMEARQAVACLKFEAFRRDYLSDGDDIAIFEACRKGFEKLVLTVIQDLQSYPEGVRRRRLDACARALLEDAAAEFRELVLLEPARGFPRSFKNPMADEAHVFQEMLDGYWTEYRGGLPFKDAPPSWPPPWYQRPIGLFAIGLLITVVGGLIVAVLV